MVGRFLVTEVPIVKTKEPISEVIKLVLNNASTYKTLNYIYITDNSNKLAGVVSIKNLFAIPISQRAAPIKDVMETKLATVRPHTHKGRVAQIALKNNIKAVPVTNSDGVMLGIVDNDKIMSIIHEEGVEDLLKFAGIPKKLSVTDGVLALPVFQSIKHRMPWLILGMFGGLLTANVITHFSGILEQNIIIAAYIPLMVYMSNAVGQQAMAFLIRDQAMSDKIPYLKYFIKQLTIILCISVILGILLTLIGYFLYGEISVARVLGISMAGTVVAAIFTGFIIPYSFIKLGFDPANTSGPIGTVIQDFLCIVIYFAVAQALL